MSKGAVLVVEDAECLREVSCDILTSHGYTVIEAANGQEALERLYRSECVPHTVLLDLNMPVMDGHEFIAKIKDDEKFQAMEVIVFTSYPEQVKGSFQKLQKPSNMQEILSAVEVGYRKVFVR